MSYFEKKNHTAFGGSEMSLNVTRGQTENHVNKVSQDGKLHRILFVACILPILSGSTLLLFTLLPLEVARGQTENIVTPYLKMRICNEFHIGM